MELRDVVAQLGLGEPLSITPISWSQRAHELVTSQGRFVVSVFGDEVTRGHLAAMQSVRRTLAADGLPVVPAIDSILSLDGRVAEIQPWVPHDGYVTDRAGILAAVAALGPLHIAMARCDVTPEQRSAPWSWPEELADRLGREAPSVLSAAAESGRDLAAAVESAQRILSTLSGFEVFRRDLQLTHGDFHARNVLLTGGKVTAIVDFERLEFRPALHDLAWPLIFWRVLGSDLGEWSEPDWEWAAACCSAYAATQPLAHDAWVQLPLLMASIPAYGIAMATDESDPVGEIEAFARALPLAEQLIADPYAARDRMLAA